MSLIDTKLDLIGSLTAEERPGFDIQWIRGRDKIRINKVRHHLGVGLRDSGKSAFGEVLACLHHNKIDIFGSRDNEGLAWCRSPIDDILFVTGDNVDVSSSWNSIKIGDLTISKMLEPEVLITVPSFYTNQTDLYKGLRRFISIMYNRRSWNPDRPAFLLIREASNFIYSRISSGDTNKDAKNDFIRFQREMRHFGFTLYVDTIRWTSIDKEMRDLADYVYFKDLGYAGLSRDVSFIYRYIEPRKLAGLPPDKFVILTRNSAIGIGRTEYPAFHKEEGEDLLTLFDITVEYGEEFQYSDSQRVGDMEHEEMMRLYMDEYSMMEIAGIKHRSASTVKSHIDRHNSGVIRKGRCAICSKVDGDLADSLVKRTR